MHHTGRRLPRFVVSGMRHRDRRNGGLGCLRDRSLSKAAVRGAVRDQRQPRRSRVGAAIPRHEGASSAGPADCDPSVRELSTYRTPPRSRAWPGRASSVIVAERVQKPPEEGFEFGDRWRWTFGSSCSPVLGEPKSPNTGTIRHGPRVPRIKPARRRGEGPRTNADRGPEEGPPGARTADSIPSWPSINLMCPGSVLSGMGSAQEDRDGVHPICPYCGTALSGEQSIRRFQMTPLAGGTNYGGLETVVCTACHKVLGVR